MARRVLIRSRHENTCIAQLEEMIKEQYRDFWKEFREDLEDAADIIQKNAYDLAPKETGTLAESIHVYVTNSRRYPGIIASAHALARYKSGPGGYKGFDYAIAQEENEEYSHKTDEESAHYLGGSFAAAMVDLYSDLTGEDLELNDELAHAYDYVKDKL